MTKSHKLQVSAPNCLKIATAKRDGSVAAPGSPLAELPKRQALSISEQTRSRIRKTFWQNTGNWAHLDELQSTPKNQRQIDCGPGAPRPTFEIEKGSEEADGTLSMRVLGNMKNHKSLPKHQQMANKAQLDRFSGPFHIFTITRPLMGHFPPLPWELKCPQTVMLCNFMFPKRLNKFPLNHIPPKVLVYKCCLRGHIFQLPPLSEQKMPHRCTSPFFSTQPLLLHSKIPEMFFASIQHSAFAFSPLWLLNVDASVP